MVPNPQGFEAFSKNPLRLQTRVVPSEEVYSYQNLVKDSNVIFPGAEYLATFTVTSAMPAGTLLVNKTMNPMTMIPGSRLFNMARNYEEFRFLRARIVHVPMVATTTDGGLIMNYFDDPDFDLGSNPPAVMFATGGYKTPLRLRGQVTAILDSKWRKCDPDSPELMNCAQGKFCVAVDTPTTVSGTLTFQLILEYVVEFRKMTQQTTTFTTVSTIANGALTNSSGTWSFASTMSPTPATLDVFLISPELEIPGASATSTARYMRATNTSGNNFTLYESLDDIDTGNIIVEGSSIAQTGLITAYKVALN